MGGNEIPAGCPRESYQGETVYIKKTAMQERAREAQSWLILTSDDWAVCLLLGERLQLEGQTENTDDEERGKGGF